MTVATLNDFFSKYQALNYVKNQTVIHAHDAPAGVFFVKSGFVKMTAVLPAGKEITLNIFKPGSYFPMIWAITDIPNKYYYKTVTDAKLQRAPREQVLALMEDSPEALFDLTKRILVGVNGLLINIEYQLSGGSYQRVAAALLISARRFGIEKKKGQFTVRFPLTHQTIAETAGMTRETVSLAVEKLEKQKIISYQSRDLVINDIKKLEEEAAVEEIGNFKPETL